MKNRHKGILNFETCEKNTAKMTSTDKRTLFFTSDSSGNNFRTAKHFANLGINISILAEKQKHSKTKKRIQSS